MGDSEASAATVCQGRSEPVGGMVRLNDRYDVPFGCLLPQNVKGLIVGGARGRVSTRRTREAGAASAGRAERLPRKSRRT